jgi:hypothetical protein
VEMKDDTLAEPYELAPGQKVMQSSTYNALQDHYGELLSSRCPAAVAYHTLCRAR